MADGKDDKFHPQNYEAWSADELAHYLKSKCGLGDYEEVVKKHDITGKIAPRLEESDLKEMGITSIGDRKRFQEAIETLQKSARKKEREKVIWEGEEVLWFSCWDRACGTCCGCCPADPAMYELSGTRLSVKTNHPARCGPIRCCCGHEYEVDNVDLTYITDADFKSEAAPCVQSVFCCGSDRDTITLSTSDGQKIMHLPKGEGQTVSRDIMNQVEEAQRIERD